MSLNKVEMLGANLFEYNFCFPNNCVCQLTFCKYHTDFCHLGLIFHGFPFIVVGFDSLCDSLCKRTQLLVILIHLECR